MSDSDRAAQEILNKMRLYVLLTQEHCAAPLLDAARQVIAGGADVIQLREKQLDDHDLIKTARELRRMTADAGIGFIVNDRPDIARLAEADGVHLGQEDLPPAAARKVLAEGQIIGVSTHSIDQAKQAVVDGADYIGVGPVFPTTTRGYAQGVGLDYMREVAQAVSMPLVAIGGIGLSSIPDILAAGVGVHICIAICSTILRAADIEGATAAFKKALTSGEKTP